MSFQLLNPPPLSIKITSAEKVSVPYQKYFTNLNASISSTLLPVVYTSDETTSTQNGIGLQLPVYTTAEINSMAPPDFVMVGDSIALVAKIRIGGIWKEITVS